MTRTRNSILCAVIVLLLPCNLGASEDRSIETGFVNLPFTVGETPRTAALYVPKEYDSSKRWPLIVYLHGGGGNGDNAGDALNETLYRQSMARAIQRNPGRFRALVLFPRCPEGKIWSPIPTNPVQSPWRLERHGREAIPDAEDHVTAAIDAVVKKFSVAEDQVVLTGHSMGGEGSTRYAALHPERVAAVAPSAGSAVIVLEDAPVLARMGVWLFQGENDNISTAPLARRMIAAIRAAGGKPRYTEYEGVGHGTARLAYDDPEVIAWMLSQRKARD